MEMFLQITIKSGLYLFFGHRQNMVQNGFPGVTVQSRSKRIAVVAPDVDAHILGTSVSGDGRRLGYCLLYLLLYRLLFGGGGGSLGSLGGGLLNILVGQNGFKSL
jgi:hypothetical protein